jgi:mono/diheme cytochrome c family protein
MFATLGTADEIGRAEYMSSCASCHGESGVGDGPLAELMTVDLPDLTRIKVENDGVFPTLKVIHIVDGRTGVRGHGYPMPVWGDRFSGDIGDSAGTYGREVLVRGRILSLVYYLDEIQQ